jgi:hypothetical protein
MMDQTKARLSMGGQRSEKFFENGVDQGDPLSAYLFNNFINDLKRLATRPHDIKYLRTVWKFAGFYSFFDFCQ